MYNVCYIFMLIFFPQWVWLYLFPCLQELRQFGLFLFITLICPNFDSVLDTWVNLTLDQPFTACKVIVSGAAVPHRDGPSFAGQNHTFVCTTSWTLCFVDMQIPQQEKSFKGCDSSLETRSHFPIPISW